MKWTKILGAVGVVALSTTTALGATGNLPLKRGMNWGNFSAIETAIKNNDYSAWVKAESSNPKGSEILSIIDTQDEFNKLVEAHIARQNGDFQTAKKIMQELGLPDKGPKSGFGINREAEMKAIESGDYAAWKALHKDGDKILEVIKNESDFQKFVQMHNARKSGDTSTADTIAKELELPAHMDGNGPHGMMGERWNRSNIDRAAEIKAIESGDYTAWKALHTDGDKIFEVVKNESDFQKFVAMHNAMKSGDFTTADSIAKELGMPIPGHIGDPK